jgi:hypothetical protein
LERGTGVRLVRLSPLFLSSTYIEKGFNAPPDHDDGKKKQHGDDNV